MLNTGLNNFVEGEKEAGANREMIFVLECRLSRVAIVLRHQKLTEKNTEPGLINEKSNQRNCEWLT